MSDDRWFRQNTQELVREWFYMLDAETRLAWVYVKAHIRDHAPSQKQAGRAKALSASVAARMWNIGAEAVQAVIAAAIAAGELREVDGWWELCDRSIVVSESTIRRESQPQEREVSEVPPIEDDQSELAVFDGQTESNGVTALHLKSFENICSEPCHVTSTSTNTQKLTPPNGVVSKKQGVTVKPPWWADHPDPLVRELCDLAAAELGYPSQLWDDVGPTTASGVEAVLRQVREVATAAGANDDAVRRVVVQWASSIRGAAKPRNGIRRPVLGSLINFSKREDWRYVEASEKPKSWAEIKRQLLESGS